MQDPFESSHSKDYLLREIDDNVSASFCDHQQVRQIEKLPQEQESQPEIYQERRRNKNKPIRKDQKGHSNPQREKVKQKSGRPKNNQKQGLHIKESRSYNQILYHYWRFQLFLHFKFPKILPFNPNLTHKQSKWVKTTEKLMSLHTFPSLEQFRHCSQVHLLHPRSLHFVFQHNAIHLHRVSYSSEEIKYMLFAFLKNKSLLSSSISNYIEQYWEDIIFLIEQGEGNDEKEPKNEESQIDEKRILQEEIKKDESLAAYQIACYLHACMVKYRFSIHNNR